MSDPTTDPARNNTTTTTTTTKSGGNAGIAFIVGILVVVVAVLAYIVFGGDTGGTADTSGDVNVTRPVRAPAACAPVAADAVCTDDGRDGAALGGGGRAHARDHGAVAAGRGQVQARQGAEPRGPLGHRAREEVH